MGRDLGVAAVLVGSVLAIYAQTLDFETVRYDDPVYVEGSSHLREGLSLDGIVWAFSGPFASNYFPLTLVSHMLDRSWHGDDYGRHHATSFLLHAVNAVLLFWALRSATGARAPSALAALLFAVHPLNVESVAWIAERKSVLSTTFWLLAMGSHTRYARRGGWHRYAITATWFACGLLCKPMVVTLPFALLLLDFWPLRRDRSVARLVREKLPLLAMSAAASWMTLHAQAATVDAGLVVDWPARAANAVVAYAAYLSKLVWPAGLALHYPHPYLAQAGGTPLALSTIAGACALLVAITALALFTARRRYPLVGWLWFVGTLVPTIGIVQVGTQAYADRYTYVPAIGLFVAVAWAGADLLGRVNRTPVARAAVAAAVAVAIATTIALGIAAHAQARYWSDSVALFERSLEVSPRNPRIRFNLANVHRDANRLDDAIHHYRIALEVDPKETDARINLATSLRARGDANGALAEYVKALEVEPDNASVHNNLATLFRATGHDQRAIAHYRYAIHLEPGFGRAHYNLANALAHLGQHEEAVVHFRRSLESDPDRPRTYNNLGTSLYHLGRYEEAIDAYRQAIALRPRHRKAHNNLGLLLARRGDLEQAIDHYRLAIEVSPGYTSAHLNLGDALLQLGRTDEAVDAYRAAVKSDPRSERARRKLARALASTGTGTE